MTRIIVLKYRTKYFHILNTPYKMDTTNSSATTNNTDSCGNCWINNFSAFKNCAPEIRNQILMNTRTKKYNKGEVLIKAGDVGGGVFCIQSGIVKVSKKGKKNKEFILWLAGTGDLVGLDSLVNNEPSSFSASAINEVIACSILASDLKIILQKDPVVSVQLMKNLCDKLNFIEQRITSISRKKIREQCAEMLISMATQDSPEHNKNMCVNYSIKDLACLIGTTKNYLYKILLELTDKKILSVRNRKIFINNMSELSAIAIGNGSSA